MNFIVHPIRRFRQSIRLKLVMMVLFPLLVVLPILILLMIYWGNTFYNNLLVYKVNSDLVVAHQYFERVESEVQSKVARIIDTRPLDQGLTDHNVPALSRFLQQKRSESGLDFLHVLTPDGRLIAGSNGEVGGVDWERWQVVQAAAGGHADVAVDLMPAALLRHLGLAARARLALLPTPNAAPTTKKVETRGMVIQAALPILDAHGRVRAIIHGGVLLNNNLDLIDTINRIVYQAASLPQGSKGTATLFLDDERIATNVRLFQGKRALGTRVSEEVRNQVLLHGKTWHDLAFVVNDWYMSGYEPIEDSSGKRIGMLYVGFLAQPFDQVKQMALGIIIGLFVLISLIGCVFSLEWAKRMFGPLERMVATMKATRAGDNQARVGEVASRDEIGQLAREFDGLLDTLQERNRLLKDWADSLDRKVAERTYALEEANRHLRETQMQLVTSEKLAAIGQLTAGVAHEINNPIAVIQGNLDVAREVLGDAADPVSQELRLIDGQVQRIRVLVTKLLQFARPDEFAGYVEEVDARTVVDDCEVLIRHMLKAGTIQVIKDYRATRRIRISRSELQQVLINLMVNAIHAMPEGGQLTLATEDWAEGAVFHIRDTGVGIPADRLSKIFNPFFTTKKQQGTGLGLSISHSLVERYGGRITVDSTVGQGSEFSVWLLSVPIFNHAADFPAMRNSDQ